jgi:hypothetical protein
MFLGPFASGLLGEENAGLFVTAVGALALILGARLLVAPNTRHPAEIG